MRFIVLALAAMLGISAVTATASANWVNGYNRAPPGYGCGGYGCK